MPRLSLLLLPVGVLVGVAAEAAAFGFGDPLRWVPDLVVGWTFIGCGLLTRGRRPESLTGLLMVATGFTWFFGNFSHVDAAVVAGAASYAILLHRGPLVHLILSYPEGRLASNASRLTVGAGYAAALVTPVWDSTQGALAMSALIALIAARRYVGAAGPSRRARLLALCAAVSLGLVLVGGDVARAALPTGPISYPVLLAYEAVLVSIALALCVELVFAPWQLANIVDLIVELGSAEGSTLRADLARALQDPSLEIGYWIAGSGTFVDAGGDELVVPQRSPSRSVTHIQRGSEPVAVILHHPGVLDDARIVEAVTAAAELAAVNARLQAEVQGRVKELEASRRRIIDAEETERRHLEQRLHRGPERALAELATELPRIRSCAAAPMRDRIDRAGDHLTGTLTDLRRLAHGLRPRILDEYGLRRALEAVADLCPVPVRVEVVAEVGTIPPRVESAAYFVCAEGLANVAKHASASHAAVRVSRDGDCLLLSVADDGAGGAKPAQGSGLEGLTARIAGLGGSLEIRSSGGAGTTLTAKIPFVGDGRSRSNAAS
jgi:signal transduction histidine kinase